MAASIVINIISLLRMASTLSVFVFLGVYSIQDFKSLSNPDVSGAMNVKVAAS